MKKIKFYKYHGTGNDFIMIDNRNGDIIFNDADEINMLCHRRFGIGADGLILLEKSDTTDFRMKYFNADGNEGSMCGNGGRCIVAFASFLGLIKNETTFEAIDGIHQAKVISSNNNQTEVSLMMQDVIKTEKFNNDYIINTGSPHYIIFRNSLDSLNVIEEGKAIRNNNRFREEGINVNFICGDQDNLQIRTYERGVEDETWSCGTGSVAAALALSLDGKTIPGKPIVINAMGGIVKVNFATSKNGFTDISLTGPAVNVYEGMLNKK